MVKLSKLIWCIVFCSTLLSCQKSAEEKVTEITQKLFRLAQEDKGDSIITIYPSLDIELMPIHSDSISIKNIKEISDDKIEVELVNNYSFDNTDESNIRTNIILYYEKSDSVDNGYIIADSKGFFEVNGLVPFDAESNGCIDSSKKYTDNEYSRRIRIAEKIQDEKTREVAKLLNNNVKIIWDMQRINGVSFALVSGDRARFTLYNPTDYSCQGFKIYLELRNIWDGEYQGKVDGYYNYAEATLNAHSQHRYSLTIDNSCLKYPNATFKNYVSSAKFETTAKDVKENTILKYTGNEYDEYMKKNGLTK